jgi:hypothetical protein
VLGGGEVCGGGGRGRRPDIGRRRQQRRVEEEAVGLIGEREIEASADGEAGALASGREVRVG